MCRASWRPIGSRPARCQGRWARRQRFDGTKGASPLAEHEPAVAVLPRLSARRGSRHRRGRRPPSEAPSVRRGVGRRRGRSPTAVGRARSRPRGVACASSGEAIRSRRPLTAGSRRFAHGFRVRGSPRAPVLPGRRAVDGRSGEWSSPWPGLRGGEDGVDPAPQPELPRVPDDSGRGERLGEPRGRRRQVRPDRGVGAGVGLAEDGRSGQRLPAARERVEPAPVPFRRGAELIRVSVFLFGSVPTLDF